MPNYVKNEMTFDGDPGRIQELIRSILVTEPNHGGRLRLDFNTIVPMPEELYMLSGTYTGYAVNTIIHNLLLNHDISAPDFQVPTIAIDNVVYKRLLDWGCEFVDRVLSSTETTFTDDEIKFLTACKRYITERWHKITIPTDREIEEYKESFITHHSGDDEQYKTFPDYCEAVYNNMVKYGVPTWYMWACDNWGTKWNARGTAPIYSHHVEDDDYLNIVGIYFLTAWDAPDPFIKALSEKFPDVTIRNLSTYEGNGRTVLFTATNGELSITEVEVEDDEADEESD